MLASIRQVGKPLRDRIVQADDALIDELQEHGRDVGDGDGAVAEVHVGGSRNAGHRLAVGGGDHLVTADGDADDDRLQPVLRQGIRGDRAYGRGLVRGNRGCRRGVDGNPGGQHGEKDQA
jgi:hypothetical protein